MKLLFTCFLILFLLCLSAHFSDAQDTLEAKAHIEKATELLSKNKEKEAYSEYDKALNIYKSLQIWEKYLELKLDILYDRVDINTMVDEELQEYVQTTDEVIAEATLYLGKNTLIEADAYRLKGSLYLFFDHFKSNENLQKTINILEKFHTKEKKRIYSAVATKASAAAYCGDRTEELNCLEKELSLATELYGLESISVAYIYQSLAGFYLGQKELNKAQEYVQKSSEIFDKDSKTAYRRVNHLLSKKNILIEMGKYEEALAAVLEANKVAQQADDSPVWGPAWTLHNISSTYYAWGKYKEALDYSLKTQDAYDKLFGGTNRKLDIVGGLQQQIGMCYHNLGDQTKARQYFGKAMTLYQKAHSGTKHPDMAGLYGDIAATYHKENNFPMAVQQYKKSLMANIESLENEPTDFDIVELVKEFDFMDFDQTIDAMEGWRNVLSEVRDQTNKVQYLKDAFAITQATAIFIDKFQKKLTNKADKLNVIEKANHQYENSIELALRLYEETKDKNYVEQALIFAESNKSMLLLDALQSDKARRFGDVPEEMLQQENQLNGEIELLNKNLIDPSIRSDSAKLKKVRNDLFNKKRILDKFIKELETKYPKYYQLKYMPTLASVKELQSDLLKDKGALLEYFWGEQHCYLFVITKNDIDLFQFKLDENFNSTFYRFRNTLTDFDALSKDLSKSYTDFTEGAHYLYKAILEAPLQKYKALEHLTIVPDGILAHLPFEVLLTKEATAGANNFKTLDYLVRSHNISYSYSSTLILENLHQKQKSSNGLLLAMAGNYSKKQQPPSTRSAQLVSLREQLEELPSAKTEVEKLSAILKGQFLNTAETSTEALFKKEASNYAIIHLAMHGILNPSYPILSSLVFSENSDTIEDNFLFAYELSNMQFNAQLVVLSACETGYGEVKTGEGVMSLARSFMYAGVPSLVVSLWQVNDQSTSILMENFYKNLSQGMNKAEALSKAKLSYLEQMDGASSHPAYWAAFIQLGDASPLRLSESGSGGLSKWLLIGGGAVVVLGLLFLFLRSKRRKE